jgi:hypothetical protein
MFENGRLNRRPASVPLECIDLRAGELIGRAHIEVSSVRVVYPVARLVKFEFVDPRWWMVNPQRHVPGRKRGLLTLVRDWSLVPGGGTDGV